MDNNVCEFYDTNWKKFDDSRVRIWKCVREFISNIPKNSMILDAGCGNGKNMIFIKKNEINVKGIDFSEKLVDVCKKKKLDVSISNICNIPYPDNFFDNVICIAVLHHLQKEDDRIKAINEMLRVCKKGGKILITLWSVEQDKHNAITKDFKYGDNLVKWENTFRYYFIYDKQHITEFIKKFNVSELCWELGNWYFIINV
jgi:ubiquinone/menaquinone biosynthesis C-methylase UbiE